MRVIVCGGRDYNKISDVFAALDKIHAENRIEHLWHGNARGADAIADLWAKKNTVKCHPVPAQWSKYGKRAGPIRNQNMLGQGIDLVVAFPGGSGTNDMITRAEKSGVKVLKFEPEAA